MKILLSLAVIGTLGGCVSTPGDQPPLKSIVFAACLEENNYQDWRQSLQAARIHMHCRKLANSYAEGFAQRLAQVHNAEV